MAALSHVFPPNTCIKCHSPLKIWYLNPSEVIHMCSNSNCSYPLPEDNFMDFIVPAPHQIIFHQAPTQPAPLRQMTQTNTNNIHQLTQLITPQIVQLPQMVQLPPTLPLLAPRYSPPNFAHIPCKFDWWNLSPYPPEFITFKNSLLQDNANSTHKTIALKLLLQRQQLNDIVINTYLQLLSENYGSDTYQTLDTYFTAKLCIDQNSVSQWARVIKLKESLRNTLQTGKSRTLLIPTHIPLTKHWALAVVFVGENPPRWACLDSLGEYRARHDKEVNAISKWLQSEFPEVQWKYLRDLVTPAAQQRDAQSCGVFLCAYAERICCGHKIEDVKQWVIPEKEVENFREKMLYRLWRGMKDDDVGNNINNSILVRSRDVEWDVNNAELVVVNDAEDMIVDLEVIHAVLGEEPALPLSHVVDVNVNGEVNGIDKWLENPNADNCESVQTEDENQFFEEFMLSIGGK